MLPAQSAALRRPAPRSGLVQTEVSNAPERGAAHLTFGKNMKSFISLILLVFISGTASAKTKSVTIYFVPWSVVTAVAMNAESVRKNASSKTVISDPWYANRFVEWLDEGKMKDEPKWKVQDLRLVVDAVQDDGSVLTFYASRFALASQKTGKLRLIDASGIVTEQRVKLRTFQL